MPKNLTAIHGRSASYVQLQEYETALTGFDLTVQAAPDNISYRFWRAITYHALGQFENALQDYDRVLGEKPKHVNALTGRGWALYQMGQALDGENGELTTLAQEHYELALDSYQKALGLKESAELWIAVGAAEYQLGNIDAAEAARQQARNLSES